MKLIDDRGLAAIVLVDRACFDVVKVETHLEEEMLSVACRMEQQAAKRRAVHLADGIQPAELVAVEDSLAALVRQLEESS